MPFTLFNQSRKVAPHPHYLEIPNEQFMVIKLKNDMDKLKKDNVYFLHILKKDPSLNGRIINILGITIRPYEYIYNETDKPLFDTNFEVLYSHSVQQSGGVKKITKRCKTYKNKNRRHYRK